MPPHYPEIASPRRRGGFETRPPKRPLPRLSPCWATQFSSPCVALPKATVVPNNSPGLSTYGIASYCSDSKKSEWGVQRGKPLWRGSGGPQFQGRVGGKPSHLPYQTYAAREEPRPDRGSGGTAPSSKGGWAGNQATCLIRPTPLEKNLGQTGGLGAQPPVSKGGWVGKPRHLPCRGPCWWRTISASLNSYSPQLDLDKQNISTYTLESRQRRGSAGPLARTPMKRWNVLKHFGTRKRPAEYEMARISYESSVPESLKSAHIVSRAFHSRP